MKVLKSFLIFLLLICAAQATIIRIPVNQSSIQAGINAANNGDTVLVAPGIYVENIDYKGKSIVVGSWLLTTGDTSYISQTVIDGNNSETVVMFENGENNTTQLTGFKITNGKGKNRTPTGAWPYDYIGGGITCLDNSDPVLSHLRIVGNSAPCGAGICIRQSDPVLKNVDICYNKADLSGGGIYCHYYAEPIFENFRVIGNESGWYGGGVSCLFNAILTFKNGLIFKNKARRGGGIYCFEQSQPKLLGITIAANTAFDVGGGIYGDNANLYCDNSNRSNIYLNYSGIGNDICFVSSSLVSISVDTFTVLHPTNDFTYPISKYSFDILHSKIVPVSFNLYVTPYGNDNNSGKSSADPLRSIAYALSKISADSLHPRTIYICNGTYKPSTGEYFPLNMRSYVSIYGESETDVILDAEEQGCILYFYSDKGIAIENLSITGGNASDGGGIYCSHSHPILKNLSIYQNESVGYGGGIYLEYSNPTMKNSTIFENYSDWGGGGIYCVNSSSPKIESVTISRNSAKYWAGAVYSEGDGNPHLINSILWNNYPHEVRLLRGDITIEYTDIHGGKAGIVNDTTNWLNSGTINWLQGNIDANPLFCNPVLATYTLAVNSPCLGSGDNGANMGSQGLGCDSIFIVINTAVKYVSASGSDILGDGSYDNPYATIQHALNQISPGDTILVYPGTYYENIRLITKDIVLASFILTTGDTSYISKTVIDGQNNGPCIYIYNNDTTSVITGFTITHGKEISGGGIFCFNSSPTLSNLIITENTANQGAGINITNSKMKLLNSLITKNRAELFGGGFYGSESFPLLSDVIITGNVAEAGGGGCIFYNSRPYIKNVTIKKNIAYYDCGGIGIYFSDAIFDSVERCNIYQNYGGKGCDVEFFNLDDENYSFTLYVDTFTVVNPTDYHVYGLNKFDILHGKIQQSNADLYVSLSGSDDNNGESPDVPLHTISYALSKIYADSLSPHCINISAGVYSRSQGEYFPLNMVDYVSLKGVSADSVILDAEGITGVLSFSSDVGNYVEDLSITRGYRYEGGGIHCEESSPSLIKISITDNIAMQSGGGMVCSEYSYPVLENCTISNNQSEGGRGGGIALYQSCASLLNTIIWDNSPDEIYFHGAGYTESCVEIAYTDVMDSTKKIITNNNGNVYWHDGNFNLNPLFCKPDSSIYSLAENSPCIGAGKNGENIGALCIGCDALEIANEQIVLPDKFVLYQNYPNPFNPTTTIPFCLPQIEVVKLSIYDINGHLVETLVNKQMEPGYHSVKWNGESYSSGVYLYKLVAGNFSATGKCLLLK